MLPLALISSLPSYSTANQAFTDFTAAVPLIWSDQSGQLEPVGEYSEEHEIYTEFYSRK